MPAAPEPAEPTGLPPHLRLQLERMAEAESPAPTIADALARGELRLSDLEPGQEVPEGWTSAGAGRLLPNPVTGRRDGAVETNLVRKGMFVTGRQRSGDSEQLMLRVLATRDRLGEIRRIDTAGLVLSEVEFQVACSICTAWRAMEQPLATALPLSLGAIARDLGWSDNGQRLARVAQALTALMQATFAGEIFDVRTGEMTFHHEFGLLQEWSAGSPHRAGRVGTVGTVSITNWLRRQLAGEHQTFYSRDLMRRLRRPSARMLLPFLESERFEARTAGGTMVKAWPVGETLFTTVGIVDRRSRQARRTLLRAGEEIVERDEGRRWLRIEIRPRGDRWELVAERRVATAPDAPAFG